MDESSTESPVGAAAPAASTTTEQRAGTTARAEICRPDAPKPTELPIDEWTGKGGDYVIGADGIRRPA